MASSATNVVALFGPAHHGKTRLVNKMCGTSHPCSAPFGKESATSPKTAESCTRSLQYGVSKTRGLFVIDTPGLAVVGSEEEDTGAHIFAQKVAVETIPLRGVYVVVKHPGGEKDDVARQLDDLATQIESTKEFIGTKDIGIIVTHTESLESMDSETLRMGLADILSVPAESITTTGSDVSGPAIEDFIHSKLHDPVLLTASDDQDSSIPSLVAVKAYNEPINQVVAKLDAATVACQELVKNGLSRESDIAIVATQNAATQCVEKEKDVIFRDIFGDSRLSSEETQNLVYGKVGIRFSLKLQEFLKTTNKLLTWDVTNPQDPRNHYRQCPHCDAVYVKVAGCANVYTCGGVGHVPDRDESKTAPSSDMIQVEFVPDNGTGDAAAATFFARFILNGCECAANVFAQNLGALMNTVRIQRAPDNEMKEKLDRAKANGTRELNIYCGESTAWDAMLPVSAEALNMLGEVPLRL